MSFDLPFTDIFGSQRLTTGDRGCYP